MVDKMTLKTKLILRFMLLFPVWLVVSYVVFWVSQGPDARFDLGNNYEMWGWPGTILKFYEEDVDNDSLVIDKKIMKIAVSPDTIIGQTDEGWLLIDKVDDEVKTGLTIEEVQDMVSDGLLENVSSEYPMEYMIIYYKWTIPRLIFIFLLYVIFSIGPIRILRGLLKLLRERDRDC